MAAARPAKVAATCLGVRPLELEIKLAVIRPVVVVVVIVLLFCGGGGSKSLKIGPLVNVLRTSRFLADPETEMKKKPHHINTNTSSSDKASKLN